MAEVRELTLKYQPEIVLIESGGDNLAANFSRELADYIIYVIDVAGTYGINDWKEMNMFFNHLLIVIEILMRK